jgi:hypothetical protein
MHHAFVMISPEDDHVRVDLGGRRIIKKKSSRIYCYNVS